MWPHTGRALDPTREVERPGIGVSPLPRVTLLSGPGHPTLFQPVYSSVVDSAWPQGWFRHHLWGCTESSSSSKGLHRSVRLILAATLQVQFCGYSHPIDEDAASLVAPGKCKRLRFNPWVWRISWRRKWQPTPVFLPGKPHGQKSLAGYSPGGHRRVGHDWMTDHASTDKHTEGHLRACLGSHNQQAVETGFKAREPHLDYSALSFLEAALRARLPCVLDKTALETTTWDRFSLMPHANTFSAEFKEN